MKRLLISAAAVVFLAPHGLAQSVTIPVGGFRDGPNPGNHATSLATAGTFRDAGGNLVSNADTNTAASAPARYVDSLSFAGTSQTFGRANFGQWAGGSFTRVELRNPPSSPPNNVNSRPAADFAVKTYGWTDPIRGDNGSTDAFVGNPDRWGASPSAPYTASLKDVFGPDASGSQNLSTILDGEDSYRARFLENGSTPSILVGSVQNQKPENRGVYFAFDLKFEAGKSIVAGDQAIDLAILERGRNSLLRVAALDASGQVIANSSLIVDFDSPNGNAGSISRLFSLRTSERSREDVGGLGINFNLSAGTRIFGFRFQYDNLSFDQDMAGPDIVAIGAALATTPPSPPVVNAPPVVVPEPSTVAQAAMGGLGASLLGLATRRRRPARS